jgi:glycerol-1-phosphate dehydrogenase [NAD(P)+]
MIDFKLLINDYKNCSCGETHECAVNDIRIGSGLVSKVGDILKENNFPKKILVIADKNTIKAADGILDSLTGFDVVTHIYDDLRVATMNEVRLVENYIDNGASAVLAVGTGSIHDPARMACANKNVPLCLFATAPSMDGFASYSAPIVDGCFKITYPAKCPEVIIGDTAILAKAPVILKSAGFGDMVSKYIAIIDWQVSALLTNESYCDKVCGLTRYAIDNLMKMADKVTLEDEETAGAIFESLLLTGIAMSFTKTSRPGSGTEHIQAHYWECKELLENKVPNYHGIDVGVSTLMILKFYKELARLTKIEAKKEVNDWDKIYSVYGALADDVKKLNTPDTITDPINPKDIEDNWGKIVEIINSVPSYEECLQAMKVAGCPVTYKEIGKADDFIKEGFLYHPYMRRRLSLKRVSHMIKL